MQAGLSRTCLHALVFTVLGGLVSCSSVGDIHECNDGLDNDGDGFIDLADEGCPFNGQAAESPNPVECNDGIDNDGDTLIDEQDPGCSGALDTSEFHIPRPVCNDGIDNDMDGKTDYPFDPGCFLPLGISEEDACATGGPCPGCSDGIDNDDDGFTDFPLDPGCLHAASLDEFDLALNPCGGDITVLEFPTLTNEVVGSVNMSAESVTSSPTCGGENGGETVWAILVREPSTLVISTSHPTTTADTLLYLRSDCQDEFSELACNDNENDALLSSRIQADLPAPGYYFLVADTPAPELGGGFRINVERYTLEGELCNPDFPECAPGFTCRPPINNSTDEYRCLPNQCRDGFDNDEDGITDFPRDPGCESLTDDTESDACPGNCPQCSNGMDDDGDGLIDFGQDTIGCIAGADDDESDECFPGIPILPYPSGGIVDGSISGPPVYVGDCASNTTAREDIYGFVLEDEIKLANITFSTLGSDDDNVVYVRKGDCNAENNELSCIDDTQFGEELVLPNPEPGVYYVFVDGFNDGDRLYDLTIFGTIAPGDPCQLGSDRFFCSERHACDPLSEVCVVSQCSNETDDDADGLEDFPYDPGCETINDNDESDDCPDGPNCSECGNQVDDDGDGRIDFGFDPGCLSAIDDDEVDECIPGVFPVEIDDTGTTGTTPNSLAESNFVASCSEDIGSPEDVYHYSLDKELSTLTFSTEGSTGDTVLSVRLEDCGNIAAEMACANELTGGEAATVRDPVQGRYFVFVDGNFGSNLDYVLQISGTLAEGQACDPLDTQFRCEDGFNCDGGSMVCVPAACDNDTDDDADGLIDFPNDPGCDSPSDDDESDLCPDDASCPQCANQIDDDMDGDIDFLNDVGCQGANDNSEVNECIAGINYELFTDGGISGTTPASGSGSFSPACHASTDSTEDVYGYRAFRKFRELVFSTVGSAGDTVLSVRKGDCGSSAGDVACRNDIGGGEEVRLQFPEQGIYYVFVDGHYVDGVSYNLSVSGTLMAGADCVPADMQFVCEQGSFCDGSTCTVAECFNGIDDDGDGDIDFPNEPGCDGITDTDESDDCPDGPLCGACGNDIDDDADGLTDYPADLGCSTAADDEEGDCATETDTVANLNNPIYNATTSGRTDDFSTATLPAGCYASNSPAGSAPDTAHLLQFPGKLNQLTVTTNGSTFDTVLTLKERNCDTPVVLACDDNGGVATRSQIKLNDVEPGQYAIIVDGTGTSGGAYKLTVTGSIAEGEVCNPVQVASGMFACSNGLSCIDVGDGPKCQ